MYDTNMTSFKKIVLIAFVAQAGYFLLSAFAFGKGQTLFHVATAIVAATFITKHVVSSRGKLAWFSPLIGIVSAIACYQLIMLWIKFINWTQSDIFPTNLWNLIQLTDLILLSLVVGILIDKVWPRLKLK